MYCTFFFKIISSFYSWFAGYMTEQQAKKKLRNEKGGAFLVRFNTPAGFLLSKKSRDVNSVVDFAIGASDFKFWLFFYFLISKTGQ